MHDLQKRRYETFHRVLVFGRTHSDLFPNGGVSRELFAVIEAVADELQKYSIDQMGGMRNADAHLKNKRKTLRALEATRLSPNEPDPHTRLGADIRRG